MRYDFLRRRFAPDPAAVPSTVIAAAALLVLSTVAADPVELLYRVSTEPEITYLTWQLDSTEAVCVAASTFNQAAAATHRHRIDAGGTSVHWFYQARADVAPIEVERIDDQLISAERLQEIDDDPWLQCVHSIGPAVRRTEGEAVEYWTVRPTSNQSRCVRESSMKPTM